MPPWLNSRLAKASSGIRSPDEFGVGQPGEKGHGTLAQDRCAYHRENSGAPQRDCTDAGSPQPQLRYEQTGFWITFVYPAGHVAQTDESDAPSRPESRLESRLSAAILILLEQEDQGKAALSKALGHDTVSGELNKQMRRLIAQKLIEMTLPEKPNSRLQKYRLSKAGLQLLTEAGARSA